MQYDVFISYSTLDQKIAEALCAYLEQHGIRCFVAYRDIPRGLPWAKTIVEAIEQSRMMVVVFSDNYNKSVQVDREIEIASDENLPILAFRTTKDKYQGAKKYYLKNINWIDAFPYPEMVFGSVVENVAKLLGMSVRKDDEKTALNTMATKPSHNTRSAKWIIRVVIGVFSLVVIISLFYVFQNRDKGLSKGYVESELGLDMRMVLVTGGSFQMGSNDGEEDEKPVHTVTLDSYYISATEITQSQWEAVMGTTVFEQARKAGLSVAGVGDDFPMYCVSWDEAMAFCQELSNITGKTYTLPSEAQWEYAARGGVKSMGNKYSGSQSADVVAWYVANSKSSTHPVAKKRPNELGLYDMSGNVWEWCRDLDASYPGALQTNTTDSLYGVCRIIRGGGWNRNASRCRVSYRGRNIPSNRNNPYGFRVVCIP